MAADSSVLALPSTAHAPAQARRHIQRVGAAWPSAVLDTALLLATEVVTNAVRYGQGRIRLVVQAGDGTIRIEVSDANPVRPHHQPDPLRDQSDPSHVVGALELPDGGRGLCLLDALAAAWGTVGRPDPPGKTVWLQLAQPG